MVTAVAALAIPASAAAQDPTQAQYQSSLDFIAQGGGSPGGGAGAVPAADPGAASAGGSLPFTGLDVALLAAVALGLLIAGLMLRRSRPKHSLEG